MIVNVPREPAGSRALGKALGWRGMFHFLMRNYKSASLELPAAPAPTTGRGVPVGTIRYFCLCPTGGLGPACPGRPQNAVAWWGLV